MYEVRIERERQKTVLVAGARDRHGEVQQRCGLKLAVGIGDADCVSAFEHEQALTGIRWTGTSVGWLSL